MQTNAVDAGSATAMRQSEGALGRMKSEDFFKLLISELKSQDPFEPSKTSDMIAQVSQIRDIELSTQLTDTLGNMTQQQRNLGAAEMIGRYVEGSIPGVDGAAQAVGGIVTAVNFTQDGRVLLELDDGTTLPADYVTRVLPAEQAPAAGATTTDTADTGKGTTAKTQQAAPSWLQFDTSLRL
jgi:flagellar basal-body rod modification protein FlgD